MPRDMRFGSGIGTKFIITKVMGLVWVGVL